VSETINACRTACRAFRKVSVIIVGKFLAGMFLQHIINTFCGSRGITLGQTNMDKLIAAFLQLFFANEPKMQARFSQG
jgi:hypothetical protein